MIDVVNEVETPKKHYRLIEQLEASCTSVALNISEEKGRFSKKEFKYFLYVARGSLYETATMLQIFVKNKWMERETYNKHYPGAEAVIKMLSGLRRTIK